MTGQDSGSNPRLKDNRTAEVWRARTLPHGAGNRTVPEQRSAAVEHQSLCKENSSSMEDRTVDFR
jgi:hypothetical protein